MPIFVHILLYGLYLFDKDRWKKKIIHFNVQERSFRVNKVCNTVPNQMI